MKTDYEMTKSLIERRDEYLAAKGKRAALRLIPRTLIPLICVAAVIISVMTLNGVFAPPKVDVSLVPPGNSNISALENLTSQSPFATTAEVDDKISEVEDALSSMEASLTNGIDDSATWDESSDWVFAAEILLAVKEGNGEVEQGSNCWHFEVSDAARPLKIVESGIIYSLIRPDEGAYEDLGFDVSDAKIYCDPLPAAVLYEIVNDNEEAAESKYVFGSLYKIVGMEGYLALISNEGFLLYEPEKWATFIVNDTNYYTHLAMYNSERYVSSNLVADQNDEYIIYYAFDVVTGQVCVEGEKAEAVYIAFPVSGESKDTWICRSYPAAPEEYRLNRNKIGQIEDTAENITRYCKAAESGKFEFNYYFIYILSGEYYLPDSDLQRLVYKDNVYLPVWYNETADTVLLEESAFIMSGENSDTTVPCTIFRVKEDRSIVAIFYNGELHYFGLE